MPAIDRGEQVTSQPAVKTVDANATQQARQAAGVPDPTQPLAAAMQDVSQPPASRGLMTVSGGAQVNAKGWDWGWVDSWKAMDSVAQDSAEVTGGARSAAEVLAALDFPTPNVAAEVAAAPTGFGL